MQKYRKYLALLFLTAAVATVTGCGISEKEASITSDAQTARMQTDEEPANIVRSITFITTIQVGLFSAFPITQTAPSIL